MIGAFLVSAASSWRIVTAGEHGTAIVNEVYNWIAAGDFSVGFTLRTRSAVHGHDSRRDRHRLR
jgi:hypothetical protein